MVKATAYLQSGLLISPILYSTIFVYNSFGDIWLSELPPLCENKVPKLTSGNNIQPFSIKVSNDDLKDLKTRLELELLRMKGSGDNSLKNLTKFWLKDYNWKEKRENALNRYPHFRVKICEQHVHFQRVQQVSNPHSPTNKTRPLLLLHGSDSSFAEFQNMISFLMQPEGSAFNFELIIPSLPGFGYSEGSRKGSVETAQILMELMERIGHDKFYIHGSSELGSDLASTMAAMYPHQVVGIHLRNCHTTHPLAPIRDFVQSLLPALVTLNTQELSRLHHFYIRSYDEALGYNCYKEAIRNSPTALAAFMLEKNGGHATADDLEFFLDNVMIAWLTSTSRPRISNAGGNSGNYKRLHRVPLFVPTSCGIIEPDDKPLLSQSNFVIADKFRQIIHSTEKVYSAGLRSEQLSEIIASDIIAAFNWLEQRGFAFFDGQHRCQLRGYDD